MARSPFTSGGREKLGEYLTTDNKSNILEKFKEFTDIGGGGSKLDPTKMTKEELVDAIREGKLGKGGFGGMSLKDILLYGGLGTGILGSLIKSGQPDGGNAQIATNRIDNTQIFDPETDVISYAAKGGVMDLQDGGESKGPGTGTSDSIPAMLSDGEFVMTAKAVRGAGGGDRREGARKMYEAMDRLEASA